MTGVSTKTVCGLIFDVNAVLLQNATPAGLGALARRAPVTYAADPRPSYREVRTP
jgi:hypothetical protein